MTGLPSDVHGKIAKALASGDRTAAAALAGKIAAAQASGDAMGFSDDLAKLQALAGLPLDKGVSSDLRTPLAKASAEPDWRQRAADRLRKAEALLAEPLAPDVLARVATVTALAKAAQSPAEVCRAKAEIDRLAGDIRTDVCLKTIFAAGPRRMGACP